MTLFLLTSNKGIIFIVNNRSTSFIKHVCCKITVLHTDYTRYNLK